MSLIIILCCIILLIVLISQFKINPFLAFLIISILAGLLLGIDVSKIVTSVQKGVGDMLGSLVIIIVSGAMLGKLVADSGAAKQISTSLVRFFGERYIQWALMVTGFVIGIPLFYNVGFVLVIPIIFSVAYRYKLPAVYVGLPMLASLSVTHGFLPPHPSPTALLAQFNADMGTTLFYGIIIAIPTVILAGPFFAKTLKHINPPPPKIFQENEGTEKLPGLGVSLFTSLLPVILIALTTLLTSVIKEGSQIEVPKVGEAISEVTLGNWLKKDGDVVQRDEVIAELRSGNTTSELIAQRAGVLKIIKQQGSTVPIGVVIGEIAPKGPMISIIGIASDPVIVMLISLAVATYTIGLRQGLTMKKVMDIYGEAVKDIAPMLLIMGGAGALKQVLIESGVSAEIALLLGGLNVHPLVLGWAIACVIRLCVGSATVAGLTAAGIVAPLLSTNLNVDPNLMVLSVGAGSLMFSHVNDAGFWLFKEYFNLSIRQTISSWSVMETIVSVAGLIGVMILNALL